MDKRQEEMHPHWRGSSSRADAGRPGAHHSVHESVREVSTCRQREDRTIDEVIYSSASGGQHAAHHWLITYSSQHNRGKEPVGGYTPALIAQLQPRE